MTKVKLNWNGVRALLKSDEMLQICREQGEQVLQRAGDGYVLEERHYPERNGVAIRVDSAEAHFRNMKDNTLLRALGK